MRDFPGGRFPASEHSGGGRGTGEQPTTARDLLAQGVCLELGRAPVSGLSCVSKCPLTLTGRQTFGEALIYVPDLRQVDLDSHVVEPVGGGVAYAGGVPLEQTLQVDVWLGRTMSP